MDRLVLELLYIHTVNGFFVVVCTLLNFADAISCHTAAQMMLTTLSVSYTIGILQNIRLYLKKDWSSILFEDGELECKEIDIQDKLECLNQMVSNFRTIVNINYYIFSIPVSISLCILAVNSPIQVLGALSFSYASIIAASGNSACMVAHVSLGEYYYENEDDDVLMY